MASLPPIKRIAKEDLKDSPDWVNQLLLPLNTFFESVYSALDRNLTLGDNVIANIVTTSFRTKSTYGDAPLTDNWDTINLANPLKVRPRCVIIGKITEVESGSVITSPSHVHWDFLNNSIRLKYISGLAVSKKYEVNLLVF